MLLICSKYVFSCHFAITDTQIGYDAQVDALRNNLPLTSRVFKLAYPRSTVLGVDINLGQFLFGVKTSPIENSELQLFERVELIILRFAAANASVATTKLLRMWQLNVRQCIAYVLSE
jgi:hypothetical protein